MLYKDIDILKYFTGIFLHYMSMKVLFTIHNHLSCGYNEFPINSNFLFDQQVNRQEARFYLIKNRNGEKYVISRDLMESSWTKILFGS